MTRQVSLSSSLTVLIAPGRNGAFMLTPDLSGCLTTGFGFGASVESVLTGQPIGRFVPRFFRLSPDGAAEQNITLRDGSGTSARVIHNAYTFIDLSVPNDE
jgi:hypothetical protein